MNSAYIFKFHQSRPVNKKQEDMNTSLADQKNKDSYHYHLDSQIHHHHSALSRWCKRRWTMPARAGRASSWPTACPPSKTQTASLSSREEWWSNRGRINSCCLRRESTTCWSPNRWATGANKKTELFFSFRRDPTLVPFIANSLLLNVQMPKSLNICSCVFLHLPFSKMTL